MFIIYFEFVVVEEIDVGDNIDLEMVNVVLDVDFLGDFKIVVKLVEGEEDIVDVSMVDVNDVFKLVVFSGVEQ